MSKNLEDLREILFDTIEGVKNGTLDIDKAKTINDLAKSINDQANTVIRAADTFRSVEGGQLFGKSELLLDNGEDQ